MGDRLGGDRGPGDRNRHRRWRGTDDAEPAACLAVHRLALSLDLSGTPLLAQILFFYAVLPQLGLRLDVLSTGLLALGVNEGARMAEIVRAGLLSVPVEQREAAASLGLRPLLIFRLVVLPQAIRVIVPPLGNNYSYMLKATSLLSVISFSELLRTSQQLAQSTGRPLGDVLSLRRCGTSSS